MVLWEPKEIPLWKKRSCEGEVRNVLSFASTGSKQCLEVPLKRKKKKKKSDNCKKYLDCLNKTLLKKKKKILQTGRACRDSELGERQTG